MTEEQQVIIRLCAALNRLTDPDGPRTGPYGTLEDICAALEEYDEQRDAPDSPIARTCDRYRKFISSPRPPSPRTDLEKLRPLLEVITGGAYDPDRLVMFTQDGPPVAWQRAGINRRTGGIFTPKLTRDTEELLAWKFRQALGKRPRFTDTIAIVALFCLPQLNVKDIDNCKKLVLDAGTKSKIWKDDRLVIAAAQLMELDRVRPRTVVAVCPCVGTLSRAPLLTATGAI